MEKEMKTDPPGEQRTIRHRILIRCAHTGNEFQLVGEKEGVSIMRSVDDARCIWVSIVVEEEEE